MIGSTCTGVVPHPFEHRSDKFMRPSLIGRTLSSCLPQTLGMSDLYNSCIERTDAAAPLVLLLNEGGVRPRKRSRRLKSQTTTRCVFPLYFRRCSPLITHCIFSDEPAPAPKPSTVKGKGKAVAAITSKVAKPASKKERYAPCFRASSCLF